MDETSCDCIKAALEKHSDMLRRICYLYLKNPADVDDVFQETFLALLQHGQSFESPEHEKAWLIRVAINKCKDVMKCFWYRKTEPIDGIELVFETRAENELMQLVLELPSKYKDVIYLFYYEEYAVPEIASMLGRKENTIYSQLYRARGILKEKIGSKDYEYVF